MCSLPSATTDTDSSDSELDQSSDFSASFSFHNHSVKFVSDDSAEFIQTIPRSIKPRYLRSDQKGKHLLHYFHYFASSTCINSSKVSHVS